MDDDHIVTDFHYCKRAKEGQMLLVYVAALYGILRCRSRAYWAWLGILAAWGLCAEFLFAGGGSLADPTGDGLIAHQVRIATNDGAGMGIFAVTFVIVYYGIVIWILHKMSIVYKRATQSNSDEQASAGRKTLEVISATLIAAGYVYIVFIANRPAQTPPVASAAVPTQQVVPDPIALELVAAAAKLHHQGPQQLDPITVLTSVSADGRVLTYHYQISRRDTSDEELRDFVRQNAVSSACRAPEMLGAMRDYGVTYRHRYMMPNAAEPVVVDASYAECRALGISG